MKNDLKNQNFAIFWEIFLEDLINFGKSDDDDELKNDDFH